MKKYYNKIVIIMFLTLIYGLVILNVFGADKSFSENENRYLSQFPKFSIDKFVSGEFIDGFEDYVQDQFVARDNWIMIKALTNQALLKLENNDVYIGQGENLIGQFILLDDTRLMRNIDFINRFNTDFSLMIVPTAAAINQQFLQPFSYNTNQLALLNVINDRLNTNISNIDIYSKLMMDDDNYFRTDHHWNAYGAYQGYKAYVESIGLKPLDFDYQVVSDSFKGTLYSKSGLYYYRPDEILTYMQLQNKDVTVTFEDGKTYDSVFFPDNLDKKDQYTYYLDGNHAYVEIVNNQLDNNETLLVIKDSYAHIMVPYLVEHFEKIIMIDLRYFKMPATQLIEEEKVTQTLILYSLDNLSTDNNMMFLK